MIVFQHCIPIPGLLSGQIDIQLWVLIVTELIGLSMIGSKEYNLIINKNYLQVSNNYIELFLSP